MAGYPFPKFEGNADGEFDAVIGVDAVLPHSEAGAVEATTQIKEQ